MNKFTFYVALILLSFYQTFGQSNNSIVKTRNNINKYVVNSYGFMISIPRNWKSALGNVIDTLTQKDTLHAVWYLPRIYSKSENRKIFNVITLIAYKKPKFNTIDEFIKSEFPNTDSNKYVIFNSIKLDINSINGRVIDFIMNGKRYKGKSYFILNKQFSYYINFVAEPDTYEADLILFETVYKKMKFF